LNRSILEVSKLETEALSHSVAAAQIFKRELQEKERVRILSQHLQGKLNRAEAEIISLSEEVAGLQDDFREALQIVRDQERQEAYI